MLLHRNPLVDGLLWEHGGGSGRPLRSTQPYVITWR
jgi:hypothetical protein